jgi:hypothetical protein
MLARGLPGALAIALGGPFTSAGDCTPPSAPARVGEAIAVAWGVDVSDSVVDAAIELWRACTGYGTDFPAFLTRGAGLGLRSIRIRRAERSDVTSQCGTFSGDTIVLHAEALDEEGRPVTCGSLEQNLAHELGHVLGLGHLEDRRRCRTHIMGVVTRTEAFGRWVGREECAAAGTRWLMAGEVDEARRRGYYDGGSHSMPLGEIDRVVNGGK